MRRSCVWVLSALGALLLVSSPAHAVPSTMNQEGLVLDQGQPLGGQARLTFSLWDAVDGGDRLWTETHDLELADGYYQVALGRFNALGAVFGGGERYLGISVNGGPELAPRQAVGSVGYAMQAGRAERAHDADTVDGVDSSKFMRVDRSTGTSGDFLVGGGMVIHELMAIGGGMANYDTINVLASPARFPAGDETANVFSGGGARLGAPMLYRSSRTPSDGSGPAPFDQAGEFVLQGTSHGAGFNRGISMVTTPDGGDPAVRMRITDTGRVGVGKVNPGAALDVVGIDMNRAGNAGTFVRVGAPASGIHIYSGAAGDMASIVMQSHVAGDPGVRMRTDSQEGGLIVEGYNGGRGDVQVEGILRAAAVEVGGITVIDENGDFQGGGGGAGVPEGALVLTPQGCDDCEESLEEAGFVRSEYTLRGDGPVAFDHDNASWRRGPDMPERKLWNPAAAADGKFYAFGGTGGDRKTYEYNPSSNGWRRMADMPNGRYSFACAPLVHSDGQEYIHCVGGQGQCGYCNVNERFNPRSNSWSTNFARMGTGRYCVNGATYENEMYVFGGYNGGTVFDWVEIYNPISNSWRRGRNMPMGRMEHNVGVADGKFYIVGGTGPGLPAPSNRVDRYDPETDSWQNMPSLPIRVSQPVAVGIGGRLIVNGGTGRSRGTSCGPCYSNTYEFNPLENRWTQRGNSPTGRAFMGGARIGASIYITGGEPWHAELDIYTVAAEGVGSVRFNAWQAAAQ